jgi:micrococcal nuclease
LLALGIAVAARFGCVQLKETPTASTARRLQEGRCDVVRVVDGDTLIVRQTVDGDQVQGPVEGRLRLLGIDCPESVKPDHPVERWGPEASAFTRDFLKQGPVRLRLDKRRQDRFGRFLAYVYVNERMLNEELVRSGLARVSTFPGDSASLGNQLRAAEREAQQAERGIWSTPP